MSGNSNSGRGRHAQGSSHYRAILTPKKVKAMRAAYRPYAFSVQKCADMVGCTFKAAQAAITFETWRHVK